MNELHPDRTSYEKIWEVIISKEINNYKKAYINCIEIIPNAKEEIWKKYVYYNTYCKVNYMKSSREKIDRHKVAACYMAAIVMAAPVKFVQQIDGENVELALNETLAISVGLSLVRAFTMARINEDNGLDVRQKESLIKKFDDGMKTPENGFVNHGFYIDNFANELHFAVMEGKLSILSLAHELFLLEVITRIG